MCMSSMALGVQVACSLAACSCYDVGHEVHPFTRSEYGGGKMFKGVIPDITEVLLENRMTGTTTLVDI